MINHILVCGLGKLGSCIAASFASSGIQVTGYDIDKEKIHAINSGKAPVDEPGLQEAINKCVDPKTRTGTLYALDDVRGTQACIFVTATPSLPDGSFDNQFLLAGIEKTAAAVGDREYIFIIASTVTPGSCEKILLPAIRKHCPKGKIVYKPELIALGTVMNDLRWPDAGLIGADDRNAAEEVFELYCKLQGIEHPRGHAMNFHLMSLVEAELAKISLNCAVTMKISFANQVGMLAGQLGADPHAILDFVGEDSRIGKKCLKPGMPYGGPCFPRDNRMFQFVGRRAGVDAHLAVATDQINKDVLERIADSVHADGDIGILGYAYKADSIHTDESPGRTLASLLCSRGRTVVYHDPAIQPKHLEKVMACKTIIVTLDCAEYRALKFGPETHLIDPLQVTRT